MNRSTSGPIGYLVDAHTHINPEQHAQALELARRGLWQFVAATTTDDCARVLRLAHPEHRIIPTCGLHPWYADKFNPQALRACLEQVPIIGEIGLDAVWTDIPLSVQLESFVYQLQLAVELGKPVILHTKGAEAEVLSWLQRYRPSQVIVHWYAGDTTTLQDYIEMDCYFTLGPDIHTSQTTQALCRQAPLERLLTETDGTDAVTWATGKSCALADVPQILCDTMIKAAALRGITFEQMRDAVYANSLALLPAEFK